MNPFGLNSGSIRNRNMFPPPGVPPFPPPMAMGFFPPPPPMMLPPHLLRPPFPPPPSFPPPPQFVPPPLPIVLPQAARARPPEVVQPSKTNEQVASLEQQDPWLRQFVERHLKPVETQSEVSEGSRLSLHNIWAEIKKSLLDLKADTEEMKAVALAESESDTARLAALHKRALAHKALIASRLSELHHDPRLLKQQQRLLKTRRHKRWQSGRKAAAAAARDERRRRGALLDRLIDDWTAERQREDLQRRQAEEQKRERERKLQRTRKQKAQDLRRMNLLVKIETLRNLRRARFAADGLPVAERPTLHELLEQARRLQPTAANKQPVEEGPSKPMRSVGPDGQRPPASDSRDATAAPLDFVAQFYSQAEESMEKLILTRWGWDAYIVPPGKGSRIPQRFLEPPRPSSSDWEAFLREPKR